MKNNKLINNIFVTVLACTGLLASVSSLNVTAPEVDLQTSTVDVMNEEAGATRLSIKKAASSSVLGVSKVFTQYGYDGTNYYLRFATAVKGNLEKVVYSATVEGTSLQLEDKVVTSVYKTITANGTSYYYNGNGITDTPLSTTRDYYWACYTIKFSENSSYMKNKINVTVNVNEGAHVDSRKTSLNSLLNVNSEYTLGDYVADYTEQGVSPQWTFTKIQSGYIHTGSNFEITQGGCTDGQYLYYTMNTAGNEGDTKNSAGYIIKYDVATKSVVGATPLVGTVGNNENGLGNGNLFFNPKDGMIYSFGLVRAPGNSVKASGFSPDYRINPNDMSVTKIGDIRTLDEFNFEVPSMETYFAGKSDIILGIDNIEYNAELDRYAVIYRAYVGSHATTLTPAADTRRMFIYDGNLKLVEGITQNVKVQLASDTNYSIQETSSDARYIYIDYTKYGKGKSFIRIYDWNGNFVKEVCIDGTSKFATASGSANIQNVIYFKGDLYFASYQSKSGLHICKVSYPNLSGVEEEPQEDVNAVLGYGELIEKAALTGKKLKLSSTALNTSDSLIKVEKSISTYGGEGVTETASYSKYYVTKGMTTDGTYVYAMLNANTGSTSNSGFDVGIIIKMDTAGKVLAYTKNSYHWGNGTRIGIVDGKLIVTRTNGNIKGSSYNNTKVYDGKSLAFDMDLNLVNDNYVYTGVTAPEGGELTHISTSLDGTRLAVIYRVTIDGTQSSKLYTYEKDESGNFVSLASNIEVSFGSAGGITTTSLTNLHQLLARDGYVYLMYTNAAKAIYKVYDYNGNEMDARVLNSQAETGTNRNYQGFLEIGGNFYYGTADWTVTTKTGFLWYKINYQFVD